MAYRTVSFQWLPRSRTQWQTYTAARTAAARLWNDMVRRHARLRRLQWTWPSKGRWERWVRRRYPQLSAQSAQQLVAEFLEAVNAARQLRKNGHAEAEYPYRLLRYRTVVYTNQDARIRSGVILLPNGKAGTLRIRIPDGVAFPGKIMEMRLAYGTLSVVCHVEDAPHHATTTIGVDLGVNTLVCATDGAKAVAVSGREAKATVQWRNKRLASLVSKQSNHQKGSRRYRRLQRRKYRLLDKAHHRIKDITHKATHKVAAAFPNAQVYVGKPFNAAAQKIGRIWAQQVASASTAKLIAQLDYKTAGAIQVNEAYSSQTCPVCGERQKCRRTYTCRRCGYTAPRDVVGATNIRRIGMHGQLQVSADVPSDIVCVHPSKYPRSSRGSSGGHPARSS